MQHTSLHVATRISWLVGSALLIGFAALACSNDDTDDPSNGAGAQGGSGGTAATGGTGGYGTGGSGAGTGGSGAASSGGVGGDGTGTGGTAGAGTGGNGTGTGGSGTGTGGTGGNADYDSGDGPCTPAAAELPANVPAILAVPAGAVLEQKVHAVGTQNYKCTATAGGDAGYSYAWVFVNPEAKLYDSCGTQVGTHSAPTGPTHPVWASIVDGSSVEGARDQSSPVSSAIPELLLHATNHVGTGIFSAVTYVQRLETVGGVAPSPDSCTAANVNELKKVDYSAYYYFYSGPPDGGT